MRRLGALCLLLIAAPSIAQDMLPGSNGETREKMQAWTDQDANCANSSVSCHMRDGIAQRLAQLGWCNPPRWQQCAVSEDRPQEAVNSDPPPAREDAHVITQPVFQAPTVSPTADPAPPVDSAAMDRAALYNNAMDNGPILSQPEEPVASDTATQTNTTQSDAGMETLIWVLGIGLMLYLLPTIVASSRKHPNAGAIFALNLFLGWSFIGWIIALVWALTSQSAQTIIVHAPPPRGDPPQ